MRSAVALIGVGNPWRRDDGVGWVVAEAAGQRLGRTVDVIESDGEPSRLLDAWRDRDLVVVVDAVRSGSAPGAIHVWADESNAPAASRSTGTHGLGIADAVALGRALKRLPSRLLVVGIEVHDTSTGQGLSSEVADAVEKAVDLIAGMLDCVGVAGESALGL